MADSEKSIADRLQREFDEACRRVPEQHRELVDLMRQPHTHTLSCAFFGPTIDPGGHLEAMVAAKERLLAELRNPTQLVVVQQAA